MVFYDSWLDRVRADRGFIARALVPGRDNTASSAPSGSRGRSIIGGLIAELFTRAGFAVSSVGWIGSIIVAVILLVVYTR